MSATSPRDPPGASGELHGHAALTPTTVILNQDGGVINGGTQRVGHVSEDHTRQPRTARGSCLGRSLPIGQVAIQLSWTATMWRGTTPYLIVLVDELFDREV